LLPCATGFGDELPVMDTSEPGVALTDTLAVLLPRLASGIGLPSDLVAEAANAAPIEPVVFAEAVKVRFALVAPLA
jgi:hypothetical protein